VQEYVDENGSVQSSGFDSGGAFEVALLKPSRNPILQSTGQSPKKICKLGRLVDLPILARNDPREPNEFSARR